MVTTGELTVLRHLNRRPSPLPGFFVIFLVLTGTLLWGCRGLPVNRYYMLTVTELEDRIAYKTEELKRLEREQEENIHQRGKADPSIEARIRSVEDEISVLARWRVRLIHLETSGRYSGPR